MRTTLVLIGHALVGWALCFATIGIGMAITTDLTALVIHAATAPLYFGAVTWAYYRNFVRPSPLVTATVFTGFVMTVDFGVVALVILGSLDMFASPLGTWIPFLLIFLSTWLSGAALTGRRRTFA
jgi:hypothetical protein